MSKYTQPLDDFMDATARIKSAYATQLIEEPSKADPSRMNVFVEAGTFDACQAMIFAIMEKERNATFTIPACAASSSFIAYGHYRISPEPPLPEL